MIERASPPPSSQLRVQLRVPSPRRQMCVQRTLLIEQLSHAWQLLRCAEIEVATRPQCAASIRICDARRSFLIVRTAQHLNLKSATAQAERTHGE